MRTEMKQKKMPKQKTRLSFHHSPSGSDEFSFWLSQPLSCVSTGMTTCGVRLTKQSFLSFSSLFRFNASDITLIRFLLTLLSVDVNRKRRQLFVDGCLLCVFFLLYSRLKLSSVSDMFDFNDSLNDVAPVSPISFPVDEKRKEKSELLMDFFCVLFLLSSPLRLSSASVVFDFNASLNDDAPVSLIQFPVVEKRKEKSELLMDVFCVSSFFCLHHLD